MKMQSNEFLEIKEQVAYYQYSADALCELRTAIAPAIAQDIVTHKEYRSWRRVGLLGVLYATDKLDGFFASRRADIMKSADSDIRAEIESDVQLVEAIAQGGRKDDKADKALTHSIFLSVAARESLNKNIGYGSLIAGSDAVMYIRDLIVGRARDKASLRGVKGDARRLGKYKQGLLVLTAMTAVAPLPERTPHKSVGQTIVKAGILGGVALSLISGIDQIKSLKKTSTDEVTDTK